MEVLIQRFVRRPRNSEISSINSNLVTRHPAGDAIREKASPNEKGKLNL